MLQQNKSKKRLVFSVTNDLNYDQRMIRICSSLQRNCFDVLLIGRRSATSLPLSAASYMQRRLFCFFQKGKLFYLEYNLRLFLFLLFTKMDCVCAIDLDTILPCYFVSIFRRKKRLYDAHELFCEMKEVVTRPSIYKVWKRIEKFAVPKFKYGYTVNEPIREIFSKEYGVNYQVIMNVPFEIDATQSPGENFIIYQGAVNHGRSFETLIPAFQWIECPFWIYGDGNFYQEAKDLIRQYQMQDRVFLKGKILPDQLKIITPKAVMGVTLFENNGLSNYYSLGNRFFDYIQAGIPQVCVNYPAYKQINDQFEVAVLINDLSSATIAQVINTLLKDDSAQMRLKENCLAARRVYNWENEQKKLIQYYNALFAK